jgi:ABC-2 type transport system permease protein
MDHKKASQMSNFADMIWIETRKAVRSRLPLWTALGSLFMPLGIAFLIFVSKNPEISRNLGLVSAKADLLAFAATDWPAYLGLFKQMLAAGGFVLFVLIISWVFGREFSDGTLKDILAVPVPRASILLAKFFVFAVWSAALSLLIFLAGVIIGLLIKLPGGSVGVILQDSSRFLITACLVIAGITPFALFASVGRGYLLPMGLAILILMSANLVVIAGWGEYYPWAVPGLYAQGQNVLAPVSYWIVVMTGLAGTLGTYLWWKYADQSR